jgi:uncharacterized protein
MLGFRGSSSSVERAVSRSLLGSTPRHADVPRCIQAEANQAALTLQFLRGVGIGWTYLSPPAEIAPGERTGRYRTGGDQLLVDDTGRSFISADNFAVALVDELERPRHDRARFTVAA